MSLGWPWGSLLSAGPRFGGARFGFPALPCGPDHRHELGPLLAVWHRDQLLAVPAPARERGHAEQRPADLTQGRVAISTNWILTPAAAVRTRASLGPLAVFVGRRPRGRASSKGSSSSPYAGTCPTISRSRRMTTAASCT